ncbi:hypothetical protein ACLOJK_035941 [Asimina triloba]
MSCNGCRVLRKGCSESCILRPCLQWIDSPESQSHATVFVAKFFGRAGLMSFISAVPESQRPGFRSDDLVFRCGSFSSLPIASVRSLRPDGEPGQRRGGAAVDGELARVPGGGGDRAAGRDAASSDGNCAGAGAAGIRRRIGGARPVRAAEGDEAEGAAGFFHRRRCGAVPILRSRPFLDARVAARKASAGDAIHEFGRICDHQC